MRARSPSSRARSGAAAARTVVRAVVQALSLVLVLGVVAYALGTLWRPSTPAPATGEQALVGISPAPSDAGSSASAAAGAATAGAYQKVELGVIAYGPTEDEVGMTVQKESRPRGPSSIAVGPDGTIYVGDDANARVQVYSSAVKHLRSIGVGEPIRDLILGGGSDLLVLSSRAEVLAFDRTSGKAGGRWALAGAPAKDLGKLRFVSGELAVESPQQVTYPLAKGSGASLSVLPSAEQERQSKKGGKAASGVFYSTSYRDGGHVYQMDDQGKVVQDFALGLPNVLSVTFLDEDRSGNAYAQVESRDESGAVVVEVRRFDKRSTATAVITLEPVTYVAMARSVVVAEDGSVYEAIPSKDSMRLVKWVAK